MSTTTERATPVASGSQSTEPTETAESTTNEKPITTRTTGRWRGIVAVVLLAAATGLVAKRPSLLLVAAVGIAFAAYPRLTAPPTPTVSISRETEPVGDDRIAVTTTIRNSGSAPLFDCRVVDGVPPMLAVVDGSPRCATTLAAGNTTTLSYELDGRPGGHHFQPTTVLCRDPSGALEVETTVDEPTEIEAAAALPTLPLRPQQSHGVGQLATDEPGDGIEFHSVESYTPGDPAARIDWRRFAKTGELSSVAFRTSVTAEVIVCLDTNPAAYRARSDSEPHAVAHAVDAAARIGDALFAANHRVGLAAIGGAESVLPPAAGREQAETFHHRLRTDPAFSLTPPADARTDGSETVSTGAAAGGTDAATADTESGIDSQLAAIEAHCGPQTQLLVLTPACDDAAVRIAHRFEPATAVTVISPDVTTGSTAGGLLAREARADRLTALRNAGIPAIDWDPTEPLGSTLATAGRQR